MQEPILIINSASDALSVAMDVLDCESKERSTDVLMTKNSSFDENDLTITGVVDVLDTETFDHQQVSSDDLNRLRDRGYGSVIVLSNNLMDPFYTNVERLGRHLNPGELHVLDKNGRIQRLDSVEGRLFVLARQLNRFLNVFLICVGSFLALSVYGLTWFIQWKKLLRRWYKP